MEYAIAKGMFDIIPVENQEEDRWRESSRWQYLEKVILEAANEYGFKEIRTPILERTELFVRGVGESSDIVSKEMYTFVDRGERSMTMRPKGPLRLSGLSLKKNSTLSLVSISTATLDPCSA